MIDKKIYYFWCGSDIPNTVKICMETWKHFLPDWEIIKISEDYVDMDLEWNRKAFKRKKWAFISDTARINFLRDHSGIYLDTDMFMIKAFPLKLLNNNFIFDRESKLSINNAFIGKANNEIGNNIIEEWYKLFTLNDNIEFARIIINQLLEKIDIKDAYVVEKNFCEVLLNTNFLNPEKYNNKKNIDFSNSIFLHMNTSLKNRKNQEYIKKIILDYFKKTNIDKKIVDLFIEYDEELKSKNNTIKFDEW